MGGVGRGGGCGRRSEYFQEAPDFAYIGGSRRKVDAILKAFQPKFSFGVRAGVEPPCLIFNYSQVPSHLDAVRS